MGKGQSKEIESEEINVVVPVNASHLASDNFAVHEVHSGTVKAMCLVLILTLMSIVICVVAVKKLCKNMRVMAGQQQQQIVVSKKHFPDV